MDRFATSSVLCFARRSIDQITWSMGFIFKVDEKLFPVHVPSFMLAKKHDEFPNIEQCLTNNMHFMHLHTILPLILYFNSPRML